MVNGRTYSVDSFDSAEDGGVSLATDSTAALIVLVPENEDEETPFDLINDDEHGEEQYFSDTDWLCTSATPLSTAVVFIYLLSPFLSLGALFVPDAQIPLKVGIPAMCIFAISSAFARYIWYMLARYVRKTSMEDIVVSAFARKHGREGRRVFVKNLVKVGDGVLRTLLATTFLRASVDVLSPISPQKLLFFPSRITLSAILILAALPLCIPSSLASKRVIITTAISLVTYVAWFTCTAYSHATGNLDVSASWVRMGSLWDGITVVAFAFSTSSTISLYGSLKAKHQHFRPKSTRVVQSFRTLLISSAVLALALIIPLLFFVSSPNAPQAASIPPRPLRACLHAATLTLTIPSLLVQCPNIPIPVAVRRLTNVPISKYVISIVVLLLSLFPPCVSVVLGNVTLVLTLFGTYLLPACIHVTVHNFKRPLSIIMPPQTPSPQSGVIHPSASLGDELLQRKEQKLQKRRLYRRLVWDMGVWFLLLSVGGGGTVWAVGRAFGKW